MNTEPSWVSRKLAEAMHTVMLNRHGGLLGIRDEGLLESALARPQQKWAYEPEADLATLAAAYTFGLAKNHPFLDGNKRIAFAAAGVFLEKNGLRLIAPEAESVIAVLALAAGDRDEASFATWLREHCEPVSNV